MSDREQALEQQAHDGGETAGMLLRRAREAAGLHVATLAVALKVPVRKLEALEADQYDQLSDAVFVRALASSVCRTLKVDPQPVLDRLPQGGKPRLVRADDGINTPFRAPGDGPRPSWFDQVSRPVGLAVVALLLAALVLILLPTVRQEPGSAATPAAADAAPTVVIAQIQSAAEAVASAPTVTAATPSATTASHAPPTMPPAVTAAAASARAASAPVQAVNGAAAAASAAAPASGIVVFRASAPSWVQVTDARGNAVLRRLMEGGETAGATGALPLSVTVGSVQSTQVQVHGKPFDLVPVTRDNVARFEVK